MNDLVKYETPQGTVELSPDIIRKYLVSGKGKVTDQEIVMFLKLCQYQKLNPFLREAYLIKYSDTAPASMVTGKETFLKRAARNPKYQGHKSGMVDDKTAWAEVYVKGHVTPIRVEVDMKEYNSNQSIWLTKPKTMLKKVALMQALREAFPEDFGGLYGQEEINTIDPSKLDEKPIEQPVIDAEIVPNTPKEEPKATTPPPEPEKPKAEPIPADPEEFPAGRQSIKLKIQLKLLEMADGDKVRVKGLESEVLKSINGQYGTEFLNLTELLNEAKMEIVNGSKTKVKTMHDAWKAKK